VSTKAHGIGGLDVFGHVFDRHCRSDRRHKPRYQTILGLFCRANALFHHPRRRRTQKGRGVRPSPIQAPNRIRIRSLRPTIRQPDGGAGIRAVAVGPDLVREGVGNRRAADHYLDLIPQPSLFQRLDGRPHRGHGRGQKGRHPDEVWLMLYHRIDDLSGVTSVPRSTTSKPDPSSIIATSSCRYRGDRP